MADGEPERDPGGGAWPPPPAGTIAEPPAEEGEPGALTCALLLALGLAGAFLALAVVTALGCLLRDVVGSALGGPALHEDWRELLLFSCRVAAGVLLLVLVLGGVSFWAARSPAPGPPSN